MAGEKFEVGDTPCLRWVVDRIVENSRRGIDVFEGVSLYRGGKDPDISRGSFDDGFKHGSLIPEVAQGYASNANSSIGFKSPDTDKFGFVAKFNLPPDAADVRFHKNFGIEDGDPGLSMKEAGAQLDALVRSSKDPHAAVERFIAERMYEARIPARLKPEGVWLLEDREGTGEFEVCRRADLEGLASQIAAERGARLICPNLHRLSDAIGAGRVPDSIRADAGTVVSRLRAYTSSVRGKILAGDLEQTLARRAQQLTDSGVEFSRLKNSGSAINSSDAVDALCGDILTTMQGTGSAVIESRVADRARMTAHLELVQKASNLARGKAAAESAAMLTRRGIDHASTQASEVSVAMDGCRDRIVTLKNAESRARRGIFARIYYATVGRAELSGILDAAESEGKALAGLSSQMKALEATCAAGHARLQSLDGVVSQNSRELRATVSRLSEFRSASELKTPGDFDRAANDLRGAIKSISGDLVKMRECGRRASAMLQDIQSGGIDLFEIERARVAEELIDQGPRQMIGERMAA